MVAESRSGFSLIFLRSCFRTGLGPLASCRLDWVLKQLLSIILTVAALLLVSLLPGQENYNAKAMASIDRIQQVEVSLKSFMLFNGRLPCPADGQYGMDDPNFGKEAANPGSCVGATPAAPLGPDAGTGNVVAGVIPTKALGLSDDYALDQWGRRVTYVVDKRATLQTSCLDLMQSQSSVKGSIEIRDASGGVLDYVMHALIVHGADGHGAFPAQGSSVANRINSGSTDPDTLDNASVDAAFAVNFANVFVRKEKTATFDDIVYYTESVKNTCCVGASTCTHTGFQADGVTANGDAGTSVATGDINGDGITDLIIGSPYANYSAGYTYVVFGTRGGFPNPLPLSSLNGSNGFRLDGVTANGGAGTSVATGDINGDGIADVIIGSTGADGNAGYTYVVFGHGGARPAAQTLATGGGNLIDGTQGFRLDGCHRALQNQPLMGASKPATTLGGFGHVC